MNSIIPPLFYARDTVIVAQELLGKKLIHNIDGLLLSGFIVETEAYCADDPASHSYKGITKRNAPMFGPVGHAYVYFIYGNHYCFNIVARRDNESSGAVLIRALEPCDGIETMINFRNGIIGYNLTNGPGKLTQALRITKKHNGLDLTTSGSLVVAHGYEVNLNTVVASPRIGINVATDKPWRFTISNNKWSSVKTAR